MGNQSLADFSKEDLVLMIANLDQARVRLNAELLEKEELIRHLKDELKELRNLYARNRS